MTDLIRVLASMPTHESGPGGTLFVNGRVAVYYRVGSKECWTDIVISESDTAKDVAAKLILLGQGILDHLDTTPPARKET